MGQSAKELGFGVVAMNEPPAIAPVRFIERTPLYYRALGYEQDYFRTAVTKPATH